jgi:Uma2 family endonuclease
MIQKLPGVELEQLDADDPSLTTFMLDERFITPEVRILDPAQARDYIIARMRQGIDKYDEVREGVYTVVAFPSNAHQELVYYFTMILGEVVVKPKRGRVFPGANVSDRIVDWPQNHRGPDVVAVMKGGRAMDCETHWLGGPDFLIEIRSPGDDSFLKLPFYSKVRVRELLIVERDERRLRLFRHDGNELVLVGDSHRDDPGWFFSEVVPLAFRWKKAKAGPRTEVKRTGKKRQTWTI